MFCCLLVVAVLGPLGLWAKPTNDGSKAICCANRRVTAFVAAAGILAATVCFLVLTLPQSAPFHHICRFIGGPG